MTIFLTVLAITALFVVYMLYRNEAVFHHRTTQNNLGYSKSLEMLKQYDYGPEFIRASDEWDRIMAIPYDTYMMKFWVWPLSKIDEKKGP